MSGRPVFVAQNRPASAPCNPFQPNVWVDCDWVPDLLQQEQVMYGVGICPGIFREEAPQCPKSPRKHKLARRVGVAGWWRQAISPGVVGRNTGVVAGTAESLAEGLGDQAVGAG